MNKLRVTESCSMLSVNAVYKYYVLQMLEFGNLASWTRSTGINFNDISKDSFSDTSWFRAGQMSWNLLLVYSCNCSWCTLVSVLFENGFLIFFSFWQSLLNEINKHTKNLTNTMKIQTRLVFLKSFRKMPKMLFLIKLILKSTLWLLIMSSQIQKYFGN